MKRLPKTVIKYLSTLIFTLLSVSAFAQELPFSDENTKWNRLGGFYVGASGGTSQFNAPYDDLIAVKSQASYSAFLGYQFNAYLGLEGGYVHFAELYPFFPVKVNDQGPYTVLKVLLPFGNQMQLYTKLGFFETFATSQLYDTTNHQVRKLYMINFVSYFGLGASYAMSEHVHFNLEGSYLSASETTIPTRNVMAGLSYLF